MVASTNRTAGAIVFGRDRVRLFLAIFFVCAVGILLGSTFINHHIPLRFRREAAMEIRVFEGCNTQTGELVQQVPAIPQTPFLWHGAKALNLPAINPSQGGSAQLLSNDSRRLYAIYGNQDAWANYVSEEYFHLFRHLIVFFGWKILGGAGRPESWAEIAARSIAELGRPPDVLLFMEAYDAFKGGSKSALKNTAVWLFMDDLHYFTEKQQEQKGHAVSAVDLVLGSYAYQLNEYYPKATNIPRVWIPHAASSIYKLPMRNGNAVVRAVLLAGATDANAYPYRALVEAKIAAGDTRFVQHKHPGYVSHENKRVGAQFAEVINSHLACITDGLTRNYTVAKIFEFPAAGCLLLVNSEVAPHLIPLGFVPGTHFLPYTTATLDIIVDAVLDVRNSASIDTIRKQGQALVWARHMVANRAAILHQLASFSHSL